MEVVYTAPLWTTVALVVMAALLGYWGYRDARQRRFNAAVGIAWLLALMITVVQVPSKLLGEVRVDGERMRWRVGPWWAMAEGAIVFADVRSVRVEHRAGPRGRLSFPATVWVVQAADGTTADYVVFDLWMDHYQEIQKHFVSQGIRVEEAG